MYDVFISYKKSDFSGSLTEDCAIAKQVYKDLSKMGLKVFYSDESLENIVSSQYKNDIDDALDSCMVMVVVLTKPEYATSKWVHYEWDSFYNDFLSGVKPDAKLFTLTSNVDIKELPRTLRNVQNFGFDQGYNEFKRYLSKAFGAQNSAHCVEKDGKEKRYEVVAGNSVTKTDIEQGIALDRMVYEEKYLVSLETCLSWFEVNPDIYVMVRDTRTQKIVAYVNVSPVTEECYENIRSGDFIDTGITADMILSYNMPFPYCVYFSSVVIHPEYQNTEVFRLLLNAIIDKFVVLGRHEIFVKKMIADAVTNEGAKFCKLFGMNKVDKTNHDSTLYEISMIPPKFRIISRQTKELFDYYQDKYREAPYLFD